MRRTKRMRAMILALLALLCGALVWSLFSFWRHARLERELAAAIEMNNVMRAKLALEHGADPNARDYGKTSSSWLRQLNLLLHRSTHDKPTPVLMMAFQGRHFQIVQLLIERGANVNLIDREGTPLLMDAILFANPSLTERLLKHGANPNIPNAEGNTALMWAAQRCSADFMTNLIKHGANVNARNKRGQTPLMWAATMTLSPGNAFSLQPTRTPDAVAGALLAHGADIDATDQAGYCALTLAANGQQTLAPFLIEHHANVNIPYGTGPEVLSMRYMIGSAGMSWSGTQNHPTLLMEAARTGDISRMHLLLTHGADINAKDGNGKTALQLAYDPQTRALLRQAGAKN